MLSLHIAFAYSIATDDDRPSLRFRFYLSIVTVCFGLLCLSGNRTYASNTKRYQHSVYLHLITRLIGANCAYLSIQIISLSISFSHDFSFSISLYLHLFLFSLCTVHLCYENNCRVNNPMWGKIFINKATDN